MNKPFLLRPSGKDYIWGGQRLNTEFNKKVDMQPLAETWECSTHPDGPSFIASGEHEGENLSDVIKRNPEYLGSRYKGENTLPILIKLIDAENDLSVQVHPGDAYAQTNENGQLGKTEMWYVLDADKDARLVFGLKKDCSEHEVRNAIKDGSICKYLQDIKVQKDQVFFIEAGTIHAIGAGCLIAEIQENSNLTYRLYDYDRMDRNGKKRELHVDQAMKVADLRSTSEPKQPMRVLKYKPGFASELLSRCKYFEVYRILVNTDRRQGTFFQVDSLSYRVLLCINGNGCLSSENDELFFSKGDCIFIPADSGEIGISGQVQCLEVRG